MLAVILWYVLGWRVGAAELLAELAIGLMLLGGGGGKRCLASFRDVARRPLLRLTPTKY